MSIIALIFLPIVLAYQIWTYWVFRKRVGSNPEKIDLLIWDRIFSNGNIKRAPVALF